MHFWVWIIICQDSNFNLLPPMRTLYSLQYQALKWLEFSSRIVPECDGHQKLQFWLTGCILKPTHKETVCFICFNSAWVQTPSICVYRELRSGDLLSHPNTYTNELQLIRHWRACSDMHCEVKNETASDQYSPHCRHKASSQQRWVCCINRVGQNVFHYLR